MVHHRFLLISYPAQGHINPALQFAKRLISMGVHVTYATSVHMHRRMKNQKHINGLSFATFSDGYDDGFTPGSDDAVSYISELKRHGSESLRSLIASAAREGRPFTCLAYTIFLPWAASVAREFHLPATMLWIQPATVFVLYYNYFHDRNDYITENTKDPSRSVELPGLPLAFYSRDLPSFFSASNLYSFALPLFKEQFEELDLEQNPMMLVNTFEELEPEALRAVDRIRMIPIGPLIPSAFLDGKDPHDTSFGGDIFHGKNNDYVEWLNSKPDLSVVYVSFGTLAVLSKNQMEELARALIDSGRPFLWVIRENANERKKEKDNKEEKGDEELSCREELEKAGKVVSWCSQVEVLSHPSLGCFVTHCGWNSTLESLATGVPVVAFPQWTDQGTNAKLIEEAWRTGVRVDDVGEVNEEGVVKREEIMRCLEVVMGTGEKEKELRENAKKWKGLAREAVKAGGSSDKNLRRFLDDVVGGCVRVAENSSY